MQRNEGKMICTSMESPANPSARALSKRTRQDRSQGDTRIPARSVAHLLLATFLAGAPRIQNQAASVERFIACDGRRFFSWSHHDLTYLVSMLPDLHVSLTMRPVHCSPLKSEDV